MTQRNGRKSMLSIERLRDRVLQWVGKGETDRHKQFAEWLTQQKESIGPRAWIHSAHRKQLEQAMATLRIRLRPRIGLALSGGGFRASIYHLGVIRRLEELGIMKDVDVISTVSGGSIIGAFYVCRMQDRLRSRWSQVTSDNIDRIRLEIFEEIAAEFFDALQHNLRTRALVFAPFYHPIKFAKSIWSKYTRSDIMEAEYNAYLFNKGDTLDQLPSVAPLDELADGDEDPYLARYRFGSKLVINTTSLLTGQRRSFSREPVSGMTELKKINTNVLSLARVVGASASVPGLFPPTCIGGDMLVDGGVSDNQGIDGLLNEEHDDRRLCQEPRDHFDLLIVSDASGQMAAQDQTSSKATAVLPRTFSVFQHELRNKQLVRLVEWKQHTDTREFAFLHLYLSLKDRPSVKDRVPSEYIPALGGIRTDLDQFSFVEREALMYHGYTLIDAQLKAHCPNFLGIDEAGHTVEDRMALPNQTSLTRPPLFDPVPQQADSEKHAETIAARRQDIRHRLQIGSQSLFLLRSFKKHPAVAGGVVLGMGALGLPIFWYVFEPVRTHVEAAIVSGGRDVVGSLLSGWLSWAADPVGRLLSRAGIPTLASYVATAIPLLYGLMFVIYVRMRKIMLKLDESDYEAMTGSKPTVKWQTASDIAAAEGGGTVLDERGSANRSLTMQDDGRSPRSSVDTSEAAPRDSSQRSK